MCVYIQRQIIYFKELTHATVGAGKSKFCRAGRQAGNSASWCFSIESKDDLEAEFLAA